MAPIQQPLPLSADAPYPLPPLSSSLSSSPSWTPVHSILASPYPLECFIKTLEELVHFPERSSSTILRAEILLEQNVEDGPLIAGNGKGKERAVEGQFDVEGYVLRRRIRRKILPKRPQFDNSMEQECLFYTCSHGSTSTLDSPDDSEEALVLLLVDLDLLERETGRREPPYYHPQVSTLAFRYLPSALSAVTDSPSSATLRMDVVALPNDSLRTPLDPQNRLFRTSIALLRSIDKVSKGFSTGYEKRVNHDLLVPKERVQDVYQRLKSKYSRVIASIDDPSPRITFPRFLAHAETWHERTDPTKHVFEDVAICAWLICLWEKMDPLKVSEKDGLERAEPEGGFVDVGCGNGLLVYLLNSEGYKGYGLDLRARKSWALYSPTPDLRLTSLSPPTILRSSLSNSTSPFPVNSFLIGNHADELTPWIPLFAALTPGSAWLNIPCCLHELTGRFETKTYSIPQQYLDSLPPPPPRSPDSLPIDTHPLLYPFYHPSPSYLNESSRYNSYQLFLAHLSLLCGFLPEREALRIPSTKNFGLVGRKRLWELTGEGNREEGEKSVREEVERLLEEVERKGGNEGWKARTPEGKAGEH
ncbi:tRNA (uracil) methyltransferase [Sporobolomyces salmoneus]|uniref:tRNA (uracil) methyltransferase n=1 Tax=Sporobolomyces salmoneus TaxID=183962 RepID=UPI00317EC6B2